MLNKSQLRTKYLKIRQKKYFEIKEKFFNPIFSLIKKIYKNKKIYMSAYYPSSYELNTIPLFQTINNKKITILLPSITKKNMRFYKWSYLNTLVINIFGMLEPSVEKKDYVPNIMLVPLLAFDKQKYRLGYGKGYYDKYLNKYLKRNKNILTIGIAFSFQKYNKLPVSIYDVKLDYILTEKGFI